MRRMCVRICQQLFAQSLFFQEGHQLCIGIPFHSGTIRRRCNAHTAGQIPHHAKRPDFTVKRFLLPHGAAGIRQHRAEKQSSPCKGGAAKVCSVPAGVSFGETPISCMAFTVSGGSTGNSQVSVQSNPQQSRQAAQVSGESIFRSITLSQSVQSSRIHPESCPTEYQSGYHRSSEKPGRFCCC